MNGAVTAALFAQAAERHAARTAVEAPDAVLTYGALWRGAGALAGKLLEAGIGRGDVIGLALEKSAAFVLAWVAVCRTGAAPVVVDPGLPSARVSTILEVCGARRVLRAGDAAPFLSGEWPAPGPVVHRQPEDLAYVVFTSGSTGQPKGVMVPERGLGSLLCAQVRAFELAETSRALFFLSTGFDAMISDLGTALASGATLVVPPPWSVATPRRVFDFISRHRITHADLPPALLAQVEPTAAPACLRVLIAGGEASDPHVLRRWASPERRVINVYGPTEATICSSLCAVDGATWDAPLLGEPLPGVEYRVVDESGGDAPVGVPGELWIGGVGVALGYAGDPELTSRRFPVARGGRWFRTGDGVVERPDRQIVFRGRLDRQLKIAGRRIEPAEIEARLLEAPGVREAAVIARPSSGRRARPVLVAFVSGVETTEPLAAHLSRTLPSWMIPATFVALPALPRNAHSKIDFAALLSLPLPRRTGKIRIGHSAVVAAAWEEVLGESPRDEDEFFARGGDSLAVIELLALCEARGAPLTLERLHERPSFAALAADSDGGARNHGSTRAEVLRADVRELAGSLNSGRIAQATPRAKVRSVFLTGGTGHLGTHVLSELVAESDVSVTCLVRAPTEREAEIRLAEALAACGHALPRNRVRCVTGDLQTARLGLDALTWQTVARETDTIVHAGGTVSLTASYDALRSTNVCGTREVLRLMAPAPGAPAKRLVYVSTLDVFVAAGPAVPAPREEDDLSAADLVHGGYAASKWASEELVRAVQGSIGPTLIARCGLLTGDSRTGKGSPRDQLGLFLRGLADLGCAPGDAPELRVDVTPVDFAARALARAVISGRRGTWHLASPAPAPLADLVLALRSAGAAVDALPREDWERRATARVGRSPEAAFAYLSLCRCLAPGARQRQAPLDLFLATGFALGGRSTPAVLAELGLACPLPTAELLQRYAVAALGRTTRAPEEGSGAP